MVEGPLAACSDFSDLHRRWGNTTVLSQQHPFHGAEARACLDEKAQRLETSAMILLCILNIAFVWRVRTPFMAKVAWNSR